MLVYWTGLRRFFVASDAAVAAGGAAGRERLPWLAVFVVVGLVGCVLGLIAVGPQRAARGAGRVAADLRRHGRLRPVRPRRRQRRRRRGQGRQRPQHRHDRRPTRSSIRRCPASTTCSTTCTASRSSRRSAERAIALDSQTKVSESKKPPADNLRPNREFPTARKSPRQPRDPSDRAARALFEVAGTDAAARPRHRLRRLRRRGLAGSAAQPGTLPARQGARQLLDEGAGANAAGRSSRDSGSAPVQDHRPARLAGADAAAPGRASASAGSIRPISSPGARTASSAWPSARRPPGIVVETECRTSIRDLLDAVVSRCASSSERLRYATRCRRGSTRRSRRWPTGGPTDRPQGWPQIAAVVRAPPLGDTPSTPSTACRRTAPIRSATSCCRARRGPDYQFATAAAVLLRVLGLSDAAGQRVLRCPGQLRPGDPPHAGRRRKTCTSGPR